MRKVLIIGIGLFSTCFVFAHSGEKHQSEVVSNKVDVRDVLIEINAEYLEDIKPIFKSKCLDCHGSGNPKPWYYVLPVIKQFMNQDISEAKEHLDMSNDFPFGGHGSPEEDLQEIKKVMNNNSMPPWQYKMMHWSSSLTKDEKLTVIKWIDNSLIKIKKGEGK